MQLVARRDRGARPEFGGKGSKGPHQEPHLVPEPKKGCDQEFTSNPDTGDPAPEQNKIIEGCQPSNAKLDRRNRSVSDNSNYLGPCQRY